MASTSAMDVDAQAQSAAIPVTIKHQGKKYDVEIDPSEPGSTFKYQVLSLTGVQPENQKILIKGRQVKDDTDMSKLGLKPGLSILVLGQPGEGPVRLQAPKQKPHFLDEILGMTADQDATPGGLTNTGNTCYLNASLELMRAIPEVQDSLANKFQENKADVRTLIPSHLREVFVRLAQSNAAFAPVRFLETLRNFNGRFSERSRTGQGYAQQDAEEAWTYIMGKLRRYLNVQKDESELQQKKPKAIASTDGVTVEDEDEHDGSGSSSSQDRYYNVVSRYMKGQVEKTLICDEPEGRTEAQSKPTTEDFWMLKCHISITVNHLRDGLIAAMSEKIKKHSDELDRDANFTSTMKISQLPKYLPVHFVRFFWKRDIQKKAKIMRKVTFPQELDISELCTDELRAKLIPVREKVREIRKEIEEMERTNKKRKRRLSEERKLGSTKAEEEKKAEEEAKEKEKEKKKEKEKDKGKESGEKKEDEVEYKTDAQIEAEKQEALNRAKEELYELVKPQLEASPYNNHTGLYQLRAVISHQGAGADSGHYTAFVKKGSIYNPKTGKTDTEDGNWWWFNDDRVSEVGTDRIEGLAGGGESHSALILLYGSVPLPLPASHSSGKFSQA